MAMSQDNQITLRGYVTAEPRLWQTKNNYTGAEIRVGSTPRWLNRTTGEWQEGEPMYFTVKCWRNLAVNVTGSVHKGDRVLIRGKFMTRSWLDDQQHRRVEIVVEADSVGHDLAYAWSFVNRGMRAPRNAMQALANGEIARADLNGLDDELDGVDGATRLDDQNEQGRDDLPPVPDEPSGHTENGYPRDDYAANVANDSFATPDAPGSQDPDEESTAEARAELEAEAVPF